MINATAMHDRWQIFLVALAASFGLALLGTGGVDWQAMLDACQRLMASMGMQITPEQMRSMMTGCMGQ